MARPASILERIQKFLHGLITPPPAPKEEPDPFIFFEEIAWLHESERIRRDALTFWDSHPHKKSLGHVTDLTLVGKFTEKHNNFVLTDREIMRLNTLAEDAGCPTYIDGQRDKVFGHNGGVAEDWIRTTEQGVVELPPQVRFSNADPLENLYEDSDAPVSPVKTLPRNNELYKAIIRMPLNRRMQ